MKRFPISEQCPEQSKRVRERRKRKEKERRESLVDPDDKHFQGRSLQRALEKKRQGIGRELPPGEGVLEDKWHPWPKVSEKSNIVVQSTYRYQIYADMRKAQGGMHIGTPSVGDDTEQYELKTSEAEQHQHKRKPAARESPEVVAAILDLREVAQGNISPKWFLSPECPHSCNVMMWGLQHGSQTLTAHAVRAQLATTERLLRNVTSALEAVRDAADTKKDLQELEVKKFKIEGHLDELSFLDAEFGEVEQTWAAMFMDKVNGFYSSCRLRPPWPVAQAVCAPHGR